MDSLREQIKQSLTTWLGNYFPEATHIALDGLIILWIITFAVVLHLFLHLFLHRLLSKIINQYGQQWQRVLLDTKLFRRLAFIIQGVIVKLQAELWFEESSNLGQFIYTASNLWILLFGLLTLFSLLNTFENIFYHSANNKHLPLRGLIQTVKLIASIFVVLIAISELLGKSPLILLSGLGALSAVLLLVFKDPILGFVAGIQLAANEMLSVGDWLEMPKYGADGDVIDIALTTVKVRNWDKTITTIPTYALISDSFKNWRGMSESGGRRIKRSILIDISSIKFLDEQLLDRLKKAKLLGNYLSEKIKLIEEENAAATFDMSIRVNGRRLTNIGTFREYLVSYLKSHPKIHQEMTLMVRQLDASSEGLPIQIYAFTNTTKWIEYENIQSDIFDHVFATLVEFDLRAHQSPTGHDVRALIAKHE
jgi:miniconductance mechanosensitive channel